MINFSYSQWKNEINLKKIKDFEKRKEKDKNKQKALFEKLLKT